MTIQSNFNNPFSQNLTATPQDFFTGGGLGPALTNFNPLGSTEPSNGYVPPSFGPPVAGGGALIQETEGLLQNQMGGACELLQMMATLLGGGGLSGMSPGGASAMEQQTVQLLENQLGGIEDTTQMLGSELGSGGFQGINPGVLPPGVGLNPGNFIPAGLSPGIGPNPGVQSTQPTLTTGPNNSVNTGRYTIQVSSQNDGQVTITDNDTGKKDTIAGDPHLTTANGTADFQHNKLTVNLPDGTKVTIDPTKGSGANFVNSVDITKGQEGVEFSGVHDGNITEQQTSWGAGLMNLRDYDAIQVLAAGGDISNLQVDGGPAINGNVGNLDQYANDA